jgi:hypothetical protein
VDDRRAVSPRSARAISVASGASASFAVRKQTRAGGSSSSKRNDPGATFSLTCSDKCPDHPEPKQEQGDAQPERAHARKSHPNGPVDASLRPSPFQVAPGLEHRYFHNGYRELLSAPWTSASTRQVAALLTHLTRVSKPSFASDRADTLRGQLQSKPAPSELNCSGMRLRPNRFGSLAKRRNFGRRFMPMRFRCHKRRELPAYLDSCRPDTQQRCSGLVTGYPRFLFEMIADRRVTRVRESFNECRLPTARA